MPRQPLMMQKESPGDERKRAGRRQACRLGIGFLLAAMTMGSCFLCSASVQGEVGNPDVEQQIKAVFLFNFAKFVDWPEDAFPAGDAPIIIGIVGENPFGAALDAAIKDETVKGRKIQLKQFSNEDPLTNCHILFFSRSERDRIPALLDKLKKAPVLTVADSEGFIVRGGMVNFVLQENKVRFEIEPNAAKRAGLKISSRLINLTKSTGDNRSKEAK